MRKRAHGARYPWECFKGLAADVGESQEDAEGVECCAALLACCVSQLGACICAVVLGFVGQRATIMRSVRELR